MADEAAAAGLRPGDVVVEADGVALAGMNVPSMRQLAFQLQKGESIEWKVKRDTEVVSLRASAVK